MKTSTSSARPPKPAAPASAAACPAPAPLAAPLTGAGCRFALVVSRFNDTITRALLAGAQDTLVRHQTDPSDITVVWVPGAFELPQVAQRLAASGRFAAILCLGAVIRGATPHFDFICAQAAAGSMHVALHHQLPVAFGVLTCDTLQQALERAGTKAGNKGNEAALAALEMAQLYRMLPAAE